MPPMFTPTSAPWSARSRDGDVVLVAGLLVFLIAPLALMVTGHDSVRPSPDSDERLALWAAVVPVAAGMLVTGAVPAGAPRRTAGSVPFPERHWLLRQTAVLVSVAVAWPLVLFAVLAAGAPTLIVGTVWALAKPVVFLLLPWLALRRWGPSGPGPASGGRIDTAADSRLVAVWGARLAPLPAVTAFAVLWLFGPFAGPLPRPQDYPDPLVLVVGATLTFLTANVTEEIFYRVMLQSRLEALLGRWPAIVSTSLLFALLHLPTHGQGPAPLPGLGLTLAAIVTYQGVFGLFVGYLWSRHRRVWAVIAAHSVVNTLPLLLM